MTEQSSFLEKVAAECGLSYVFALSTIRRACERAGVAPGTFAPQHLEAVGPHIEKALRIFMAPEEVEKSMSRILIMAYNAPGGDRAPRDSVPDIRKPSG